LPLIHLFFKELKLIRKNKGYSKEYGFISKKDIAGSIALKEIKMNFKKEGLFTTLRSLYKEFYFFRSYRRISKKIRKMKKEIEREK